jgi:hypothetical protein
VGDQFDAVMSSAQEGVKGLGGGVTECLAGLAVETELEVSIREVRCFSRLFALDDINLGVGWHVGVGVGCVATRRKWRTWRTGGALFRLLLQVLRVATRSFKNVTLYCDEVSLCGDPAKMESLESLRVNSGIFCVGRGLTRWIPSEIHRSQIYPASQLE